MLPVGPPTPGWFTYCLQTPDSIELEDVPNHRLLKPPVQSIRDLSNPSLPLWAWITYPIRRGVNNPCFGGVLHQQSLTHSLMDSPRARSSPVDGSTGSGALRVGHEPPAAAQQWPRVADATRAPGGAEFDASEYYLNLVG